MSEVPGALWILWSAGNYARYITNPCWTKGPVAHSKCSLTASLGVKVGIYSDPSVLLEEPLLPICSSGNGWISKLSVRGSWRRMAIVEYNTHLCWGSYDYQGSLDLSYMYRVLRCEVRHVNYL